MHPKNEGDGNRVSGAIAKAEGVVPGVPDLMLLLPAVYKDKKYNLLGIELKTPKGKQGPSQKVFEAYFEASGSHYIIIRDDDSFRAAVEDYMQHVPTTARNAVKKVKKMQENQEKKEIQSKLKKLWKKN
jgi:hypothetical protein